MVSTGLLKRWWWLARVLVGDCRRFHVRSTTPAGTTAHVFSLVARCSSLTPAYTDTVRRAHIRARNRELEGTLASLDVQPHLPASEEEKAAIKRR